MADNLPQKVLIIDTDTSTAGSVADKLLKQYKIEVVSASDLEAARYRFEGEEFPVVFIDLQIDDLHGLVLIQKLRSHNQPHKLATSFVLMIGKTRKPEEDSLIAELGGIETIAKPFNMLTALPYLSRGLANYQKSLELEKKFATDLAKASEGTLPDVKAYGTSVRELHMLARLYEAAKCYEDGHEHFQLIIATVGESSILKHYTGHFASLLLRHDKALEALAVLNQKTPRHLQRLRDLTQLYVTTGDADQAKKSALELISYYEDDANVKFEILDLLLKGGMENEAKALAAKMGSAKDTLRYYNNLGVSHSSQGDHLEAVNAYKRCIILCPKHAEIYRIHFNAALSLSRIKTEDTNNEAIEHLSRCLELKKDFEKAQNALKTLTSRKAS